MCWGCRVGASGKREGSKTSFSRDGPTLQPVPPLQPLAQARLLNRLLLSLASSQRGQLTHATSHPCRSPLYMFLPGTYFAITSVGNGCEGQGGIVGAAEQQGVGRGQDKGCCVSSMTMSGAGSHRGTAAFQGALLLPSVPSWREGNPAAGGAGVSGLVGDVLCSCCRNQPLNTFPVSPHRCWVYWCGLSSPPQRTTSMRPMAG